LAVEEVFERARTCFNKRRAKEVVAEEVVVEEEEEEEEAAWRGEFCANVVRHRAGGMFLFVTEIGSALGVFRR
jgi:hypothetical protein